MADTPHLGLPHIDGGQAQKHVTHNDALRILDSAIQIAVRDITRTVPPATPADGDRHVVADGASGAWAGRAAAIASWQDGAWAFLTPKPGWHVWSIADDMLMVFDGDIWRAAGSPPLNHVPHLGINADADTNNRLSVRSNAALLTAITSDDGGSGDVMLQLSREDSARAASVVFSDNYSGRAEFGLIGSSDFKLKVSPDGTAWIEALSVNETTGNLALPRGLALTGVVSPAVLTADQHDFAPAGHAAASVLQISADAPRSLSGLAGGSEGRIVCIVNAGSQPLVLLDESAASAAANRFALGAPLMLAGKRAAILRYDATATRWQAIAGHDAGRPAGGMANRIINPCGAVWQLANGGAAAIVDGAYAFDQWYGLTQLSGVTASQVLDAENGTPVMMRLTQAGATAQRFGLAQPIEAANIKDFRGKATTLTARVRMSAAATLRYAVLEWTGPADSLTRDVVNDWTVTSYVPGGFFIAGNMVVAGTGAVTLSANVLTLLPPLTVTASGTMSNLIVMFWTDSAQPQNATLDIANVQLEAGAGISPFAPRAMQDEQTLCARYLRVIGRGINVNQYINIAMTFSTTIVRSVFVLGSPMRAAPQISLSAPGDFQVDDPAGVSSSVSILATSTATADIVQLQVTVAGMTSGHSVFLQAANVNARIYIKSQL